jgi:hypothetical protein
MEQRFTIEPQHVAAATVGVGQLGWASVEKIRRRPAR